MVTLRAMTESEFTRYRQLAVESYASENVAAGHWGEVKALDLAEKAFSSLLPEGRTSRNHHLLSIIEDGAVVGFLWFAGMDRGKRFGFIYDLVVNAESRGRGIGKAALVQLETYAKEIGLNKIDLQVFAHNDPARRLYEAIGYRTTTLLMSKTLDGPDFREP